MFQGLKETTFFIVVQFNWLKIFIIIPVNLLVLKVMYLNSLLYATNYLKFKDSQFIVTHDEEKISKLRINKSPNIISFAWKM